MSGQPGKAGAGVPGSRAPLARDLALITLLTALLYLPGLTTHGVTNWQEGQRLIVARDMQDRWRAGEGVKALVVPTVRGEPYLAKPPLIYWAQLALAEPFGARVSLVHLRLVAALAGIAGVLATYWLAAVLFGPDRTHGAQGMQPRRGEPTGPSPRSVALWSAALLATGILSTRSARIGELDILLVPLCTAAIACIALAWRSHRERARTRWPAVLGAAACAILAVLAKDPAVMVIGFGGYAAMALYYGRVIPASYTFPAVPCVPFILPALAALAAGIAALRQSRTPEDYAGVLVIAAAAGGMAHLFQPVLRPARFLSFIRALARTHPLIVLGSAVAARLGWAAWVDRLTIADTASQAAAVEADDNLRLFIPEAPINNLEAALYGAGLGSLAAAAVVVWWTLGRMESGKWKVKRIQGKADSSPLFSTLSPPFAHLLAWTLLTLFAFSILGKGVPRYLTPLWPALSIIGGWGVSVLLAHARATNSRRWLRPALISVVCALGIAQTVWYGYAREALHSARSPRRFMEALLPALEPHERTRIFSHEFATPALEYHAHTHVRALGDPRANNLMAGGDPKPVDELRRLLARDGGGGGRERTAIILIRTRAAPGTTAQVPVDRLRAEGFTLDPIPLPADARFTIDSGRTAVAAYRASVAP